MHNWCKLQTLGHNSTFGFYTHIFKHLVKENTFASKRDKNLIVLFLCFGWRVRFTKDTVIGGLKDFVNWFVGEITM